MGLLIGVGNTKPKFPYDYYYGIEWDTNIANSAATRIGRPELHVSLPIQSRMRRCLLNDAGKVVTYLHANDSTKTDTGGTANLTGASGQVMVEIPAHYRKFEQEGTKYRAYISEFALPGFHFVPLAYRSAYEAAVDRTVPGTPKLSSVVNLTPEFRGGANTADWDGTYRSLLGRPASVISLTNFRNYARNRGAAGMNNAGWNCDVYDVQKTCYWLYSVEYANFNSQLAFNAEPDASGYKQGGLGEGVSTLSNAGWTDYNGRNPFIACGITNELGNKSGVVNYTMPEEYGVLTVEVPSYRGLENPFGHIWKWTDGCKCNIQSDTDGGKSEFFTCSDPAKFQDSTYTDYEKRGELPRADGYVKALLVGEFGENMPANNGGSPTTYFADYFYTSLPASGESQRGVLFGGGANDGSADGLTCAFTYGSPSSADTTIGSRLCYLP